MYITGTDAGGIKTSVGAADYEGWTSDAEWCDILW